MEVVAERAEVAELFVGLDGVVFAAAFALPAIVDVHVTVAVLGQPGLHQCIRRGADVRLGHIRAPAAVGVAAHDGSERDFIADHDAQLPLGAAPGVDRTQCDLVGAALLERTVIRPVASSSVNPAGRFSAENCIGRSPVAGIRNRNGLPGRTPTTRAPLIRGSGFGFGVRMLAAGWASDA